MGGEWGGGGGGVRDWGAGGVTVGRDVWWGGGGGEVGGGLWSLSVLIVRGTAANQEPYLDRKHTPFVHRTVVTRDRWAANVQLVNCKFSVAKILKKCD